MPLHGEVQNMVVTDLTFGLHVARPLCYSSRMNVLIDTAGKVWDEHSGNPPHAFSCADLKQSLA
jgi:hypothetical protein